MRETQEETCWQTRFQVEIDLGAGLSRREQIVLFNAARHCEVHKLLAGELAFDYSLVGGQE